MVFEILLALATKDGIPEPASKWQCSNQIEVWCAVDSCAARPADGFTPMSIVAEENGAIEVCAYSGCWQAQGTLADQSSRLLWTASDAPFSTAPDSEGIDLTLLIDRRDGIGFVRAGGIASPLLCSSSKTP